MKKSRKKRKRYRISPITLELNKQHDQWDKLSLSVNSNTSISYANTRG